MISSIWTGKRAPRNPLGGCSLEWQAPTPPPLYNFEKPPILHEIYNYDDLVEVEPDVWERVTPTEVDEAKADAIAHATGTVADHTGGATAAEKAAAMVHTKAEEVRAERKLDEPSAGKPLTSAEQAKAEEKLVRDSGIEEVAAVEAAEAEAEAEAKADEAAETDAAKDGDKKEPQS